MTLTYVLPYYQITDFEGVPIYHPGVSECERFGAEHGRENIDVSSLRFLFYFRFSTCAKQLNL